MIIKEKNSQTIHSSGFTLVEVLVVSVLIVVVAAAVFGLQYSFGQNQLIAWRSYQNTDEANRIVREFIKELRTARTAETAAFLIESATDNEIIFFSDIDFDSQSERVRYTLNSSSLEKGVIDPEGQPPTYPQENERVIVLADNVRNQGQPLFVYYNGDWPIDTVSNPLPENQRLAAVQSIKISLIVNNQNEIPAHDYSLESTTQIRMLKTNQ